MMEELVLRLIERTAAMLFRRWRRHRRRQWYRAKMGLFDHISPKIEVWLPGSGPPPDTPKNLPSLLDPEFTPKTREMAR
jgi:hypothetical protein